CAWAYWMPEKSRRTAWGSVPTDCSLALAIPPSVVNLWHHTRTRRGRFPLSYGRVGVPRLPRPCLQKRRLRPEGDACVAPTKGSLRSLGRGMPPPSFSMPAADEGRRMRRPYGGLSPFVGARHA